MAIVTTKLCRKQAFSTTRATKHGAFRRLSRSPREWALEWALDTTVPSPPLPSVTRVLSCHLICSNSFFICSNFISYAATIFLLKQLYLIWNFTVAKKIIVQMWLAQHKFVVHTCTILITKTRFSNLIAYQHSDVRVGQCSCRVHVMLNELVSMCHHTFEYLLLHFQWMTGYFFNNVLPMQPQEKRNYQSFPHCDDKTTCEWSWFMFEASYLPLVRTPHWHPLGLMGSELYVKVLLCQLYLISLK